MIWLAWLLQIIVVVVYLLAVRKPSRMYYFNAANAICGSLLFVIYVVTRAYAPIPLDLAFTFIGAWGCRNG